MKPLTTADANSTYPGRYELNDETIAIARDVMRDLWNDRLRERGEPESEDRSSSCKFAALLARELFGGRLAGNEEHVFVMREGQVLDLNAQQQDVLMLGDLAHIDQRNCIQHRDYRTSLGTCMPRVSNWLQEAERRMPEGARALKRQDQPSLEIIEP